MKNNYISTVSTDCFGINRLWQKEEVLSNYNKYTYGKIEVYIPKDLTLGEGKDLNGINNEGYCSAY